MNNRYSKLNQNDDLIFVLNDSSYKDNVITLFGVTWSLFSRISPCILRLIILYGAEPDQLLYTFSLPKSSDAQNVATLGT